MTNQATPAMTTAVRALKALLIIVGSVKEIVIALRVGAQRRAGASGFLLKDVTAERLFYAVRVVAAGEALLAPAVTRCLISEFARLRPRPGAPPASALAALIPRETQLLRLVAEGLSQSGDSRPPARERRHREDARQPGAGQAQAAGLDAGGHRL